MEREPIAIVTDSACDLPPEYVAACDNLYVLPLRMSFPDGTEKSDFEIGTEEVCRRMDQGEKPVTTLPAPDDVEKVFNELREKSVRNVLFVMMSSGLSGTLNMVSLLARQHSDFHTLIYDTKILSMGLGYMVMNAVELVRSGAPFEGLMDALAALRPNVDGMFYLPSLEHLSRGGRLGLVASMVGKLLNIRPIIACNDEGRYYPRAACIGAKRTVQTVVRMVSDFAADRRFELSVVHAGAEGEARSLMDQLKALPGLVAEQILPLSPALTAHVGRGMLAICTRVAPQK